MTVQEHIEKQTAEFRKLSAGRQKQLARQARDYIAANPGCADHSTFWRGLSARQVTYAANTKIAIARLF